MKAYFLNRMWQLVLIVFAISVLSSSIIRLAPGDAVDRLIGYELSLQDGDQAKIEKVKAEIRHELGLDLPPFYLSFSHLAMDGDFFHYDDPGIRKMASRFSACSGEEELIAGYIQRLLELRSSFDSRTSPELKAFILRLIEEDDPELHEAYWKSFESTSAFDKREFLGIIQRLNKGEKSWKRFIPMIYFHTDNQYHRWLFGDGDAYGGALKGDFGKSFVWGDDVMERVKKRIPWSISLTLMALLLSFGLSIPFGVFSGARKGARWERWSSQSLFLLVSIPSFWFATVLLFLFANPDNLYWFPAGGVKPVGGYPPDAGLLDRISLSLPYLVLPTICYAYAGFAYLSRLMRGETARELETLYAKTARTRGISERKVRWRYAFRASLLPLLTLCGSIFPALIGGSVIIESIYAIPGMGEELLQAVLNRDYPVLMAVFTISGLLSALGYLVSDLLYFAFDPRVRKSLVRT